MAGELLQYSGLITKTRAMRSRLLKKEDFERIAEFQTVPETIDFLREQESYGKIYGGREDIRHRGQVEELIHTSILEDYQKLYRFGNEQQRKALALYLPQLQFGDGVPKIENSYFTEVWKKIGKFSESQMKQVLWEVFGTQADWLNIMWMYRGKEFFRQKPEETAKMLIPLNYKLKRTEKQRLLETEQTEEFCRILGNTMYFKGRDALVKMQDEISYHQVMKKMYQRICRKYPASMAPVFYYFYEKEQEIERLTTALEGIRYQVPARELRKLIII
ncbi:MAG: V-type ATPase subunit [Lachnospiraceae bacterium]|jgi:vacuolar-type H+-ATPase subunit C/Vma6|nr:V-type ATPase subunit [Lachnospiraceae bacterium]GFI32004.1 V-type ATP synthase subunit C [Lachnospiraceae bacterium]